ncbi:XapX domain-containing protein [Azospirillum sp. SYSU D00513]|uniref:XapX domain-containing protein n=1 Tax=Azospirillum sp. SYSU D00513 TaxID=2812561 RepID=UPI001A9716E4|nr:XapX domain-containing protein [Azospirillum sp. SYSU D00513]
MKVYLLSLGAGLLVGVIYALLNVRSPAPPVVALIGLLGILLGEQIPPLVKSVWRQEPTALSWLHQIQPHMFGHLPKGQRPADRMAAGASAGAPAAPRVEG